MKAFAKLWRAIAARLRQAQPAVGKRDLPQPSSPAQWPPSASFRGAGGRNEVWRLISGDYRQSPPILSVAGWPRGWPIVASGVEPTSLEGPGARFEQRWLTAVEWHLGQ